MNKSKKKEITEQETDDFFSKDPKTTDNEQWINEDDFEGQLSVDVYDEGDKIIIKSTIAGVKPEDIDISINNEMVTIKGKREQHEEISEENYYYQECYWGGFSRSIILPVEVRADKVDASLKNGVLKVVLPKAKKEREVSIKVSSED